MRLSSDHDLKYLRLGLILVFTGFLFALIFVTRVNARELSSQIYDTEAVLVYDNDPLVFYGCDHALYFYQDSYTDELLLSSSFNPESQQLYDFWYGSRFLDFDYSWGYSPYSYSVLKGHIINLMGQTNYFSLPQGDTIANVELKEIDLDDSYVAFYFMDSNFNYYCYVSYIPQNSETLQPYYPFDNFTINDSGHFVEQDPVFRELFVWDFSNQRWIYSSVSSSQVVVHTVIRFPYVVYLESGAQVYVQSSRFLIDEPLPTATPTLSPTPDPNIVSDLNVFIRMGSSYYMFSVSGSFLSECTQPSKIGSNDNYPLLLALNNSNLSDVFVQPNFIYDNYVTYKLMYIYVMASSIDSCLRYDISSDLVNSDPEIIKASLSPVAVNLVQFNSDLNLACLKLTWSDRYSDIQFLRSDFHVPFYNAGTFTFTSYDPFLLSSNDLSNPLYRTYLGGLRGAPSPTPDPNSTPTPEPTATPTSPPYVIIITPEASPSPTPPFVIPSMPPLNPPGDGITPLDPELQEDVFGVFKSKIGDNNSFGLFGLLIGLLPGDLMWYIWFLLFVLLVVGVAKLIIHFTGG